MVSSAYKPVVDQEEDRPESSGSSSAHVGSNRYTPEEGSDDDELEDLEESEGYELKRLKKSGSKRGSTVEDAIGDDDHDDDEDEVPATRRRTASVASFELYTPDEEHRVRRKLDTHLVLFVAMLYMMSFLDRSNIGNAKIAGLVEDLKLDDDQYEWLLTAFYIAYILFEWMTLCYKIFPPHIYISCCVMAWGVLASLQSITSSFGGLLVLRTLLGIGEAAFVGIPFYLSFFFRKDELAFRIGLFISAAPLATSFASSLAWGIVSLGGKTGIASWRLLFLLEGFPACLVAVWAWWWLPDNPASARWLRDRDRKVAILRMRKEDEGVEPSEKASAAQANLPRHKQKFNWRLVLSTLKDPKAYLTAGMFFCCNVAFSSMPVFLPTIVSSMGFSQKASQGLSAPPFLFAFFVVLVTAFLSDRIKSRSIPMIFHATLTMLGYIVLAVAGAAHFGH
ncbi:MFS general substrate transporter, partial [Hortaea werneckii]